MISSPEESVICPHFWWIWKFQSEVLLLKISTFSMFKVLITSIENEKTICLNFFPYLVHPFLGPILGKETPAFEIVFPLSWCCVLRPSAFSFAVYCFEPRPPVLEASELGATRLLAPNYFKSVTYRACPELLSGVVGSRVLTRNQCLGSAFSEIKLLTKWNWGSCEAGRTTCLRGSHKPVAARCASLCQGEREPLSACLRTPELWVCRSASQTRLKITGRRRPSCFGEAPFMTRNRLNGRQMIASKEEF